MLEKTAFTNATLARNSDNAASMCLDALNKLASLRPCISIVEFTPA